MWIESNDAVELRIDQQDRWLCDGVPLQRNIAQFFAKHVQPQMPGGYAVCIGPQRWPVHVHDTPYWVVALTCSRNNLQQLTSIQLSLSDGKTELLAPATLFRLSDERIYCLIERQQCWAPCRWQAKHVYALANDWVEQAGRWYLPIGGQSYPVLTRAALPDVAPSKSLTGP